MYRGPHHKSMADWLCRRSATVERNAVDQPSTGPSGVDAQSIRRMSAPASPPPARQSAALELAAVPFGSGRSDSMDLTQNMGPERPPRREIVLRDDLRAPPADALIGGVAAVDGRRA